MSFYRIYRPQLFDEIDNIAVRDQLLSFLSKDKKDLPHAYLFTGPKGAGKTTAARLIAKLFNCEKPVKGGAPCGTCGHCKAIEEGRFMDLIELDAASNRGIDEMRQLRDTISLSPSGGMYRIYIIDEVHMLTTEAFNALLKTLEEPPAHAIFVLATTDPEKIPATITSRCVHIQFHKATSDELMHALTRIVKKEIIPIDNDALLSIAGFSDGAFRDAIKLLEQVSFLKGTITKASVEKLLFVSADKVIFSFLRAVVAKNSKEAIRLIEERVKAGQDTKTFTHRCLGILEEELVGLVQGKSLGLSQMDDISHLIKCFTRAYGDMKISPIAQLPLELAVVEFCDVHGTHPEQPSRDDAESEQEKVPGKERQKAIEKQGKESEDVSSSSGPITLEKLIEHWKDIIEELKPFNHSVAGVMRSARPKGVNDGIVTIEAFYAFHQEKLSEIKTREVIATVLKKLFGMKVNVEVVLGKK